VNAPLIFSDAEHLATELVARTEILARTCIFARGRFTCALTGGSAATLLYPALARAELDWTRVEFFYGDERCVPVDSAESNHALAFAALGKTGAKFHRIDGVKPPPIAAREYEANLPPLDLVHLGMGPDGHVCSLFPGHALLTDQVDRVASLTDSPKPPPARVTLTLRGLREAAHLWFLVLGESKREAVRSAMRDPTSALPAAQAFRSAASALWFLDHPAASLLTA
jgi:6-phosphogluconolactonase